jgi:hypothetical protein|nr:MAG TPA: hypothetical protein [Crassvirales sp.]
MPTTKVNVEELNVNEEAVVNNENVVNDTVNDAPVGVPEAEAPVDEVTSNDAPTITVDMLRGKPYKEIVAGLKAMPDWLIKNGLKVTNVGFDRDQVDEQGRPKGYSVSISVGAKLDAYLMADATKGEVGDEYGYVKTTSSTVFTSAIQVAAILKQNEEIMLANAVLNNPKSLLTILEGARISVFAKEYAAGETESSPFSAKEGTYVFEHDTIRYYIYDIVLGSTAKMLKQQIMMLQAQNLLNM